MSVKLSALGLEFDRDLALANIRRLVRAAADLDSSVRIDMEHSGLTDATFEIYRALRGEGLDRCGVVIQSYLRRSLRDVRALAPLTPNVRLVKGIYVEPKAIAYTDPGIIQRNFVELLEELVAAGSYVAVATHDQVLVDEALRVVDRHGWIARATSSRRFWALPSGCAPIWCRRATGCACTCPTAMPGTAMRCGGYGRTRAIAGHVARDVLRAPWACSPS